jgi:2-hydroxychromene-2-carboxylate isomerase
MKKVEFHFDFGSPNAYLSHLVIPAIEQRTGAKFQYVPILLGGVFKLTNNRSPAESLAGIKNKPQYERLETTRFIRRHGITKFHSNPFFPVNTLMIMRGAIAARAMGVFEPYVREVLDAAGFDSARWFELIQSAPVKDELLRNTEQSVERGTFGSPTFFVDGEIFFGKDRLREVEEMITGD